MIRDFESGDIPRVKELLAASGISYDEPDWEQMFGQVFEDDRGCIRFALLHRKTVETYALADRTAWDTPALKSAAFRQLDQASVKQLAEKGYEDQHCWVPPKFMAFLRRLKKELRWVPAEGPEKWHGLVRWIGNTNIVSRDQ